MTSDFPPLDMLLSREVVALDVECNGLDWVRSDKIFGISMAWKDDAGDIKCWYGDIREDNVKRWCMELIPMLPRVAGHNFKFDAHMLRQSGMPVADSALDCTMVREALLDEDEYNYSLERISQDRLGRGKVEIWQDLATLFGGKPDRDTQILNLYRAPKHMVKSYAEGDVLNTLEIWYQQQEEIESQELEVVADLERQLLGVVIAMEKGGVRVDVARAEESLPQLEVAIDGDQRRLDSLASRHINVNSSPQVKELLGVHQESDGRWFTRDGLLLEPTESGKSGQLKTEKLYQCKLPEAALIAQIRGMIKARDVFLKKYIIEMNYKGYVHANINQTRSEQGDGTYTGRFSITEPALQQIHKRNKKLAAIVRSCFIPDEGSEWGSWDHSQVDFRVFAHFLNDERILEQYRRDPKTDFHGFTAKLTGLPRDKDEKTGGGNAKQINLGLIFGMSAGRMAKEMSMSYTKNDKGYFVAGPEAQEIFSRYHAAIPGANRIKESVASVAKTRGYIRTQLGRRLRFPDPTKAYKAAGILYQAQAAEMLKVKMVELAKLLQGRPARFMLTVHDEYNVNLQKDRNKGLDDEITNLLQKFDGDGTPLKLRVPILADFGLGASWYDASC